MAAKRDKCIKVCFEQRLFDDLKAKATRDDRNPADVVYVIVRRFMYGDANGSQPPAQGTDEDHESP